MQHEHRGLLTHENLTLLGCTRRIWCARDRRSAVHSRISRAHARCALVVWWCGRRVHPRRCHRPHPWARAVSPVVGAERPAGQPCGHTAATVAAVNCLAVNAARERKARRVYRAARRAGLNGLRRAARRKACLEIRHNRTNGNCKPVGYLRMPYSRNRNSSFGPVPESERVTISTTYANDRRACVDTSHRTWRCVRSISLRGARVRLSDRACRLSLPHPPAIELAVRSKVLRSLPPRYV